jgi:hypothetical protein
MALWKALEMSSTFWQNVLPGIIQGSRSAIFCRWGSSGVRADPGRGINAVATIPPGRGRQITVTGGYRSDATGTVAGL